MELLKKKYASVEKKPWYYGKKNYDTLPKTMEH